MANNQFIIKKLVSLPSIYDSKPKIFFPLTISKTKSALRIKDKPSKKIKLILIFFIFNLKIIKISITKK